MYHAEFSKHAKLKNHKNIGKLTKFYKVMYARGNTCTTCYTFLCSNWQLIAIGNSEVSYFMTLPRILMALCVITKFNYCYCVELVKRSIEIAFPEHFYLFSAASVLVAISESPSKEGCW